MADYGELAGDNPSKRRKLPNFSEEELLAMITAAAERKKIIFGPFSSEVSRQTRDAAWTAITNAVNSVGRFQREKHTVRKKFRDYRSEIKKKLGQHKTQMKRTGGGSYEKLMLKPSEDAMINLGLLEQEAVEGLEGIPDSEDPDPEIPPTGSSSSGSSWLLGAGASTLAGSSSSGNPLVLGAGASTSPSPPMSTWDEVPPVDTDVELLFGEHTYAERAEVTQPSSRPASQASSRPASQASSRPASQASNRPASQASSRPSSRPPSRSAVHSDKIDEMLKVQHEINDSLKNITKSMHTVAQCLVELVNKI